MVTAEIQGIGTGVLCLRNVIEKTTIHDENINFYVMYNV